MYDVMYKHFELQEALCILLKSNALCQKLDFLLYKVLNMDIFLTKTNQFTLEDP